MRAYWKMAKACYPKTRLTMKTSHRRTLSGNVADNLIRVERRRAVGRQLCRTGFGPLRHFTVQQARTFPVRSAQAAWRISRGEMDGWATVGGPRVS